MAAGGRDSHEHMTGYPTEHHRTTQPPCSQRPHNSEAAARSPGAALYGGNEAHLQLWGWVGAGWARVWGRRLGWGRPASPGRWAVHVWRGGGAISPPREQLLDFTRNHSVET